MFYIWEFILIDLMQTALRVHFKNHKWDLVILGASAKTYNLKWVLWIQSLYICPVASSYVISLFSKEINREQLWNLE